MGLISRINSVATAAKASVIQFGERTLLAALRTYYAVMEIADRAKKAEAEPVSKPLRNPVHRLVEFYVTHMWPGDLPEALPIVIEDHGERDDKVIEAIHRIWEWSNFSTKKQYAVREFCLTGDFILKIVGTAEDARVWLQVIDPSTVTTLEKDDRGRVTYIRLDVPKTRRDPNGLAAYTYTEVWDEGGMRTWSHDRGQGADLKTLGRMDATLTFDEAGIDRIPFVHAPFRDVGQTRGMNVFWHALDKIDEADAMASNLHRLIFRYKSVVWAVEQNAVDSQGRPLAPPKVNQDGAVSGNEIALGREQFLAVSGTLKCLVPPIDLGDANDIVKQQVMEIEKDLPELLYYRAIEGNTQVATQTMRLMLAPAIARLLEARSNAEAALVEAHKLALRMGQALGLRGFEASAIGTEESGAWEHMFENREVLPLTEIERAELQKAQAEADRLRKDFGIPMEIILEERGYTPQEIARIKALAKVAAAEKATLADELMDEALRRFDQGAGATTRAGVA